MRIHHLLAIVAVCATALAPQSARADEDLSIVVNPVTGAASIRNDSDSAIDLDGYLLRSGSSVFDPVAWLSLEEQLVPGWVDGPAAANRLGDTNLLGSTSLPAGGTFDLGLPYLPFTPGAIGEVEPGFNFTYNVPGVGSFTGDVEFSVQNNIVLVVDQGTGEAMLQNQSGFTVSIDSYLITSANSVLSTAGWDPLANSDTAWAAATGAANRIAEGNLLASTQMLAGGGSLDLGSPIDATLLSDENDLSLLYNIPGVGQIVGGVLFVGGVSPGMPGDANGDGAVDILDLDILSGNFGTIGGATVATGDFNGDMNVDILDLDILSGNFGSMASSSSSAAIPEPATALIALVGLGGFVARGRR